MWSDTPLSRTSSRPMTKRRNAEIRKKEIAGSTYDLDVWNAGTHGLRKQSNSETVLKMEQSLNLRSKRLGKQIAQG